MGLKKKNKQLDWWIKRFGEVRGKKLFLERQAYKRRRTLKVLDTISGGWLGKLVGLVLR